MAEISTKDAEAYAAAASASIGDNSMALLYNYAELQLEREKEVAAALEALKKAQERLAEVQERDLPNEMERVGIQEFTLKNGMKVKLKTQVRTSIAGEKKGPAIQWLRDHGRDAIIQQVVSVAFGKGEDRKARELLKRLARSVRNYSFDAEEKVPSSTLAAFVREALAKGEAIPLETFGVFRQNLSEIEMPGEVKKRAKKGAAEDGPAPF